MTSFVLLHGAFRGGWAWDRVRPDLEAAGHDVHAPDLTDPAATLESYIDTVCAVFEEHGLDQVLLVGHSQGGFIARAASQRLASRIAGLVYLDAPVPRHGQRAFDFRPAGIPEPAVSRGDVIAPRPVGDGDGLTAEDAAWINERLVGQPVAPSMDPVTLTDRTAIALPESYVFFERTPPGFPCATTRTLLDETGTTYRLIDAPHDGIVTHPGEVARILLDLS